MMGRLYNKRVRIGLRWLTGEESGQSLILIGGAIVTLVAIIGLGVDVGLVFVERVQLARAMDAAALAGAQELPKEKAAHERALEYLEGNDYDTTNACIETHGSDLAGGPGSCNGSGADTIIIIDTLQFRNDDVPNDNTANRINVRASQSVPLTFVRVIGFNSLPVSASATAENIEDLDIVIVYDRSGSMQQDTRCYGCWEPDPVLDYRAGPTFPLPYTVVPTTGLAIHCEPSDPVIYQGYQYLSIEAEHYSHYLWEADYHHDQTEHPKSFWSLQRQPGKNGSGPDSRGSWMMVGTHGMFTKYYENLSDVVHPPDYWTTPRLDYDFSVPVDGDYYVWIRAQGGSNGSNLLWGNGRDSRRKVHLGMDGTPMATGSTCFWGPYNDGASSSVQKNSSPPAGNCNTNNMAWSWSRVLTLPGLAANAPHTLNIWAAGQGVRVDKIVITDDPRGDLDRNDRPLDWTHSGVADGGPGETHGRTGWACMGALDPRFGPLDPVDGTLDDLYDDYQPIRAAKEAAKNFVRRLNPEIDQIGYVWYSTSSSIRQELYCVKQFGSCADFENVVSIIETTAANGSTNIGDALWDGIRVLTTGTEPAPDPGGQGFPPKNPGQQHWGRPSAAHILVLMTDGQANQNPNLPAGYGNCYSDDLWPDSPGEPIEQIRARECVAWFGHQARDQGVVVYTIGLGSQADNELLAYVADITGGWYYFAPSGEELEEIFESLYERIFLRLTD